VGEVIGRLQDTSGHAQSRRATRRWFLRLGSYISLRADEAATPDGPNPVRGASPWRWEGKDGGLMVDRFVDDGTSIYTFLDPIWVECPRCGHRAVISGGAIWPAETAIRIVCESCGHCQERDQRHRTVADRPGAIDPFFDLPLWLQAKCCGRILWAHNVDHIAFLETYVNATLRTREPTKEGGWRNHSLASRLPRWITSAKNRNDVMRGIGRLKAEATRLCR